MSTEREYDQDTDGDYDENTLDGSEGLDADTISTDGEDLTVDAPESLVITGDRDRLTQALVGLTSNAVRHTPAGTPVWLTVVELPGAVRVEVADAGPGIPPEHLAHVFERFHRVDRGRSSSSGGTGLGLAIVEAIARAHGGTASVVSTPGQGSTFSLTLPR